MGQEGNEAEGEEGGNEESGRGDAEKEYDGEGPDEEKSCLSMSESVAAEMEGGGKGARGPTCGSDEPTDDDCREEEGASADDEGRSDCKGQEEKDGQEGEGGKDADEGGEERSLLRVRGGEANVGVDVTPVQAVRVTQ